MTKVDKKCVVIHNGTHSTVAGFSNMELPSCIIPSTYLQKGNELIFGTFEMLDHTEQDDPETQVYTMLDSHGLPYNWEALEAQWRYLYKTQLKVSPTELPLVISVPASHAEFDMQVMEKYFDLAFARLGVPLLQIVVEPLAVALSMGKSSALVVDLGAKGCTVTPIVDGTVIKSGVAKSRFGGNFLDFQVARALAADPAPASSARMWHSARTWIQQFKSTMLQVSDKSLAELERYYNEQLQLQQQQQQQMNGFQPYLVNPLAQKRSFLLQGTRTVTLELKDCHRIAESLFHPNIADETLGAADGLGELLSRSIRKAGASVSALGALSAGTGASLVCAPAAHANAAGSPAGAGPAHHATAGGAGAGAPAAGGLSSEQVCSLLLSNVIITGGTSLIGGTEQRIINELSIRFPQYKLSTYANQIQFDRKVQSWISMSAMAALPGWDLGRWYTAADLRARASAP